MEDFLEKARVAYDDVSSSSGQIIARYLREEFFVQADRDHPHALRPGIDVISVDNTANWWPRDPLAEIFHFRGREVDKLGWRNHIHFMDTPFHQWHSETDNSDMQGTVYFAKRFMSGEIACVVRIHPSMDKYGRDISMIGLNLPFLLEGGQPLPLAPDFYETSRVIIDDERLPRKLPDGSKNPDRTKAFHDCLAASVLFSHEQGYRGFFCFMPDKIWEVAYKAMGLEVERLGPSVMIRDREDTEAYSVYAGYMLFSDPVMDKVRERTGFSEKMLFYGVPPRRAAEKIADYIHGAEPALQTPYQQVLLKK